MNLLTSPGPLLFLLSLFPTTQAAEKPNIVVIVADDLGWSDVGYRDSEMTTPVIDKLASEGVKLNFSYMMKSCSPSRSSLLTGVYAFRMGTQDKSLSAHANNSVPLDKRFFPQDLQDNGYSTHYVGKWHLGFCRKEMTPTYRGFHTFYGKYNGAGDYYTHIVKGGYDMQDDKGEQLAVDKSVDGNYSTFLFTNKAVEIIENHNKSKPLFLFLAYQAVHGPLQVPDEYITKYCANVTVGGDDRKKHCAMTAAMDEGIGKVMTALKDKGLYDNLITFFTSDNGGPVKQGASNWPLRGSKITEWEGGTRVVSFLHSTKHLPDAPYVWNGLIHVVDWYPTLLRAAGIKMNTSHIDGKDIWNRILRNSSSPRKEFVYNLNQNKENYSLRWGKFKLVNFSKASPDGWYNPPAGQGVNNISAPKTDTQFMLFNIDKDPTESKNLIKTEKGLTRHNQTLETMKAKIAKLQAEMVPPLGKDRIIDPKTDLNGVWTTGWC